MMLKAGEPFIAGRSGGIAGAFVRWGSGYAGVAPAHIFRIGETDILMIGGQRSKVAYIPEDADLAFFPVRLCEPSRLDRPRLGEAVLENAGHKMCCKVTDVSPYIAYVMLQPRDLPGPGESGTPLIQNGFVTGILLSINLGTCKATVISADVIRDMASRMSRSLQNI